MPEKLTDVFASFNSADLEVLASFAASVRELQESRFGRNLEKLGEPPKITEIQRRPEGGGRGMVRVRHASSESRAAIFAAARRLRTESEFGSFNQACRALKGSTKRRATKDAAELGNRIEAAKRRIRDAQSQPASVGAVLTDDSGKRSYVTRAEISELAEYGHHFHQKDETLRRDWLSLPEPLLEPSVDEALRAAIEAAIAIHPIVEAVLADPALRAP